MLYPPVSSSACSLTTRGERERREHNQMAANQAAAAAATTGANSTGQQAGPRAISRTPSASSLQPGPRTGAPPTTGAPGTAPRPGGAPSQPRPNTGGAQPPQQQGQTQQRPTSAQPQPQRPQPGGPARPTSAQPPAANGGGGLINRRASPSPSPPVRSSSNSSLSSLGGYSDRVIEMEDDVPLVAEVFENQRYYPMVGWSRKLMDRPPWSTEEGHEAKPMDEFKVPPGWSWAGEWAVEINEGETGPRATDAEGWSYATEFSRHYKGSSDASLKAVRRRRHFRRRIPPAKSVKVALGFGGAATNSLTVGYLKNPLAVASNTVRAASSAAAAAQHQNSLSMRTSKAKAGGAGPSLAELYAKQTVDPPAGSAAANLSAVQTNDPSPSPQPFGINVSSPNGSNNAISASPPPPLVPSSAADVVTADAAPGSLPSSTSFSTLSNESTDSVPALNTASSPLSTPHHQSRFSISSTSSGPESPWMRPKYTPFASLEPNNFDDLGSTTHGSGRSGPFTRKLEKSMVRLWEFQRYYPIAGWSTNMLPTDKGGIKGGWINEGDGKRCDSKTLFKLTPDWRWNMESWTPVIDSSTDVDGWSYAIEPSRQYHSKKSMEHFVRRRMWQREKIQRAPQIGGEGGLEGDEGQPKKSYTIFFERLELFKKDLKSEENDDDKVAMSSACW